MVVAVAPQFGLLREQAGVDEVVDAPVHRRERRVDGLGQLLRGARLLARCREDVSGVVVVEQPDDRPHVDVLRHTRIVPPD